MPYILHMPKRSSKRPKPRPEEDENETAYRVVREVIGEPEEAPEPKKPTKGRKNPAAVALGKLGGKKGGAARAKKLSPRRRKQIAKKAALARWKGKKRS